MLLADNFETVLRAFNRYEVDYMIAGGYAVVFHGYGRTTGDLDIWVKPAEENREKIVAAFESLEFPAELTDYLRDVDFSKPFAVKIGGEPIQVDVFNAITGVTYEAAKERSVLYLFSEKLEVHFIHLHDLIINKMLADRPKDRADVDELQKINIHSKDRNTVSFLKKLFKKS